MVKLTFCNINYFYELLWRKNGQLIMRFSHELPYYPLRTFSRMNRTKFGLTYLR